MILQELTHLDTFYQRYRKGMEAFPNEHERQQAFAFKQKQLQLNMQKQLDELHQEEANTRQSFWTMHAQYLPMELQTILKVVIRYDSATLNDRVGKSLNKV